MTFPSPPSDTACIITAAGSSTRFSQGRDPASDKKEYALLEGRSLLSLCVDACRESGVIGRILIVHSPGHEDKTLQALGALPEDIEVFLTPGGETRQDSVRLGLEYLEKLNPVCLHVLIHDGARPWVTPQCIRNVLDACIQAGGAVPVIPVTDAVKQVEGSFVTSHLERSSTFGAQTPQGFEFPGILAAHRKAMEQRKTYIDDTEVYCDYGGRVKTVPGDLSNRKVTYTSDLNIT